MDDATPAALRIPPDALELHRRSLVLDSHTDVPMRLLESGGDLRRRLADRHVDLPRLRAGGVDAVFFALYVPPELEIEEGRRHLRTLAMLVEEQLHPGGLERVRTSSEVRAVVARGAVAVLLGLENGRALLSPGALDEITALGVRYVTLTHMASHEWCDASTDRPRHGGLAAVGRDIVAELDRRGILIDVSHVSDAVVEQTLTIVERPIIASHSSSRALCDQPRNLPDALVRAIAAAGGVVMANAYPGFLDPAAARAHDERVARLTPILESLSEAYAEAPQELARAREALFAAHRLPPVPLDAYLDHIVHLVEVAGAEHVGIGTDFDGIPETPVGFASVEDFPRLTAGLLARGLPPATVRSILGENFLRVLEQADAAAAGD